jgi:putative redox protein
MSVSISSVAGQPYRQVITARQHTFYSDAGVANGGKDTAPSPHELLLAAVGACTAMTLQIYANRRGWDLQSVNVNVDEQNLPVNGKPKPVPHLTKTIQVRGKLDPQQLQTLEQIAEKCPVNKLINEEKVTKSSLNLVV